MKTAGKVFDPQEQARRFSKMAWIQHYVNKNIRPCQDLKAGWRGAEILPDCHPTKTTKKSATSAREEARAFQPPLEASGQPRTRRSDDTLTVWAPSPDSNKRSPPHHLGGQRGATTTTRTDQAVVPARKPLPLPSTAQETIHPVLPIPPPGFQFPRRPIFPPPPAAWTTQLASGTPRTALGMSPHPHRPYQHQQPSAVSSLFPHHRLPQFLEGNSSTDLADWMSRTLVPNKNRVVFILGLLVCWDHSWYGLAVLFAFLLIHC
ncbi:hypothetical protein L228DRAFT_76286 [Xylona heveae TC161]|uniref:Uncharacterized protein n=1 Tax=Xylona heveae (strain CBS 132557 / TC161) TaxID=1328760 RepID=A0A165IUW1_XYLHT|nr:hypothetical protein L228DRAFT_76286 [Xylona heveae TC161]KZF25423.1 hypothetical protein L228DRAFT_76286 [Xylona heveae TC161]